MTDQFLLSIVIPHHNTPDLLEKLLSTIPNEKEIQTIIIDDHSDQEAKRKLLILQSFYVDRNFLFLDNNSDEHNPGVTRNIGLNYIKGKWLLFADADDYFLEDFYEIIKKYFDSDYDIVFFTPISQQLDTGKTDTRHVTISKYINDYIQKHRVGAEANLRYFWPFVWSKLIRSEIVLKNKITFESIRLNEDDLFSVRTSFYAKKICASFEKIYCVTRSSGSITTKRDKETFDIGIQEQVRKFNFLKEHLSKKEFRASDAYKMAVQQLLLILQRGYGWHFFIKYFKIFRQNKMMIFNIRIFSPINFVRWIRRSSTERRIKIRYER